MSGDLMTALLLATCIVSVPGQVQQCQPNFSPRPNCSTEPVQGWLYWRSMQYKYFPRLMSMHAADLFCAETDGEVCAGEVDGANAFIARLGSFIADGEDDLALRAAYRTALISSGQLFWTGVTRIDENGRLYYTDGRASEKHSFVGDLPVITPETNCVAMDGDTGEMQLIPCTQKLPFVCKIQPNRH